MATLIELLKQMEGVPRHLSIHVGGVLITAAPLVEVVPLERATMPGRVVVQWDKDSVEDAGLIKIDLLALRTLGMIEERWNTSASNEAPPLISTTCPWTIQPSMPCYRRQTPSGVSR